MDGEGSQDEKLRNFLECYRRTPSMALDGDSPFEKMTGRKMPSQLDALSAPMARKRQVDGHGRKMAEQFNHHHGVIHRDFNPGDLILNQFHSNNKWNWLPGIIISKTGAVNYQILMDGRVINAHTNQWKLCYHNDPQEFSESLTLPSEFSLSRPQIQPPISPAAASTPQEPEDSNIAESEDSASEGGFISANEDLSVVDPPEICSPAPTPPRPRPPAYLNNYERNLDDTIIVIKILNLVKASRAE